MKQTKAHKKTPAAKKPQSHVEAAMAEAATGCVQQGALGKLYIAGGTEVHPRAAKNAMLFGCQVHVPNAGAGSYRQMFVGICGYEDVKVIEDSSSAGDWSFGVLSRGVWMLAFQENRYPHHGFAYSLSPSRIAKTFEALCGLAMAG